MDAVQRFPSAVLSGVGVSGRAGSTLSSAGGAVIVFGGADRTGEHFGDAFYVDLPAGALRPAEISGVSPPKCGGHAAISIAKPDGGALLLVFGGIDFVEEEVFNDVFEATVDGAAGEAVKLRWRRPDVSGPRPDGRTGHSLTAVPPSAPGVVCEALLFGGCSPYSGPMADLHALRMRFTGPPGSPLSYEWAPLEAPGDERPAPREMHHAFLRPPPAGDGSPPLLVVVGGRGDAGAPLRSLHAFDLRAGAWLPGVATPHAVVSAAGLSSHGGAVVHLYGGWAGDTELQAGVVTLDTRPPGGPAAWTWTRVLLAPPRVPRFAAAAALVRLAPAAPGAPFAFALPEALRGLVGGDVGTVEVVRGCDAELAGADSPLSTSVAPAPATEILLAFGGMAAEADLNELVAVRLPRLGCVRSDTEIAASSLPRATLQKP